MAIRPNRRFSPHEPSALRSPSSLSSSPTSPYEFLSSTSRFIQQRSSSDEAFVSNIPLDIPVVFCEQLFLCPGTISAAAAGEVPLRLWPSAVALGTVWFGNFTLRPPCAPSQLLRILHANLRATLACTVDGDTIRVKQDQIQQASGMFPSL